MMFGVPLLNRFPHDSILTDINFLYGLASTNSDQCKLMHPGNHKLLQLELKEQGGSTSAEASSEMDTTDNVESTDSPAFQRVGEFAQMG